MACPSSPSTPEAGPSRSVRPGTYRAFTLPTNLINTTSPPATATSPSDKQIETLFSHACGKVVSFNTSPWSGASSQPGSSSGRDTVAERGMIGTLPWTLPTERTIAVGPLRIYRVRSSGVAFLHSGRLLHPIMSTSQSWCVDGESKFVLRVRDGVYYRLELPWGTDHDKAQVDALREVLGRVLKHERTACPFQRGFHVPLPEGQDDSPTRVRIRKSISQAKKWRLRGVWVPEDGTQYVGKTMSGELAPPSGNSEASCKEDTEGCDGAAEKPDSGAERSEIGQAMAGAEESTFQKHRKRFVSPVADTSKPRGILDLRCLTAPPQLAAFQDSLPTKPIVITEPMGQLQAADSAVHDESYDIQPPQVYVREDDTASNTSSLASFHTAYNKEDSASPLSNPSPFDDVFPTPKPHGSHHELIFPSTSAPNYTRAVSNETLPALSEASAGTDRGSTPSPLSTPTLMNDMDEIGDPSWSDAVTPPGTLRLRLAPKHLMDQRDKAAITAPYTPSFFTPRSPGRGLQLTAALLQKVHAIFMGDPTHLVTLMLQIAARIANGASILHSFDLGNHGEKMAGTWNDSDEEDGWDEDDFGVPLSNARSNASFVSAMEDSTPSSAERQRSEVD